jgi:protein-tyrosine phosphatase
MTGFVDLHCHWVPGVDDGARDLGEAEVMLSALGELGFTTVLATPHMRPGLFDNTRASLLLAYRTADAELAARPGLPQRHLSAEHYLDDVVFARLMRGEGLPYPGEHAALLEFYELDFPPSLGFRLADLRRGGLLPVVAHPERYPRMARQPELLQGLLDVGAAAMLDLGALSDQYGRQARRTAETFLERGFYHAACSDAHHPADVSAAGVGIRRLKKHWGEETMDFLLREGPLAVLEGRVPV